MRDSLALMPRSVSPNGERTSTRYPSTQSAITASTK